MSLRRIDRFEGNVKGGNELTGRPGQRVRHSADRAVLHLAGMPQPARPGADRPNSEPIRVVVDTTGPPVLNEAAAAALLRILVRAAERLGTLDVPYPAARPVLSDS